MSDVDPVVEGKPWALMAYLWILCLIPLIMKKDNPFAFFHAKQGLLLFLCSILLGVIAVIPVLGILSVLGNVVIIILSLIGIFNVLIGNYWKVPILGEIARNLKF